MIILIDIGNTRAKYCTINKSEKGKITVIENQFLSGNYLNDNFIGARKIIIASVSHIKMVEDIKQWCRNNNIIFQEVTSEKTKRKVKSGYSVPNQLGVDRWLSIIGTVQLYPNKNVLIIDAGTATTVDFVNANGEHQGGWILAGISLLIQSVLSKTANVKIEDTNTDNLLFGVNTTENVNNAAWAATVGTIIVAVEQLKLKGYNLDEIILTGGNAVKLSEHLSYKSRVIDDLIFTGLQAYI